MPFEDANGSSSRCGPGPARGTVDRPWVLWARASGCFMYVCTVAILAQVHPHKPSEQCVMCVLALKCVALAPAWLVSAMNSQSEVYYFPLNGTVVPLLPEDLWQLSLPIMKVLSSAYHLFCQVVLVRLACQAHQEQVLASQTVNCRFPFWQVVLGWHADVIGHRWNVQQRIAGSFLARWWRLKQLLAGARVERWFWCARHAVFIKHRCWRHKHWLPGSVLPGSFGLPGTPLVSGWHPFAQTFGRCVRRVGYPENEPSATKKETTEKEGG